MKPPSSSSIDHSQEVRETLTRGQRTQDIDMNVRKPPGRTRDGRNRRMDVGGDFTPLTSKTRLLPQANVTREARPNKLCRDQSPRGMDTRVKDIME